MESPEVPTEQLHEEIQHHVKDGERWTLGVALSSALLAAMAAIASLQAGHYANEAMISQIESSSQWSYFQSKSIKEAQLRSKMEILDALGKPASGVDAGKAAEYKSDKEQIQKKAEDLEETAKHHLRTHQVLARSVTMFQVAIVIGAISVLTRRRPFWFVSMVFGMVGLYFTVQSMLSIRGH